MKTRLFSVTPLFLSVVFTTAVAQQFIEAPQYATNGAPRAVTTADFNGDGYVDIAAGNTGSSATIQILLANSDGTFRQGQQLGAPGLTSYS
ncbi:MAG: VCBS repeat-containing protein, partial [Acidobacteriales bacterium]|nr:VCBS repeat-containing protein [Terriglobales bacterium]